MKLTATIATLLPLVQTSEAIYLACCQTTRECPQYYNTVDTFVKDENTYNACCYPDEEARTEDLPKCVHPIVTEDGVGISVMSLPSVKLEGGNETVPQIMEMEEITITEGNEEISIAVTTSLEESSAIDEVSTEDDDEEEESAPNEETAPYGCCAVASTVQALRAASNANSVCAKHQHHVDNFTVNLSLLEGAMTSMQVCCDEVTKAEDVNLSSLLPCADQVEAEHTSNTEGTEDDSEENDQDVSETNALNAEEGTSSANGFGSAALSIAALCVVVQTVL